jgi:hypothetical protein
MPGRTSPRSKAWWRGRRLWHRAVMHDDLTFFDEIEAYCGRLSYRPGAVAELHVSTHHPHVDVVVERWGAEREIVWRAERVPATFTPLPVDADSVGCRWPVTVEIPIDERWRSGFHLVTVTAPEGTPGRDVAHACFVVTADPVDRARTLLVLATNTWNAYNPWGGRSLYTGGRQVSFRRPFARGMLGRSEVERDDRKSRPTRWGEDHDVNGDRFQEYRTAQGYPAAIGSSGWFSHERRFVEWAEAAGYRFDVCISTDLDDDPSIADGYDLIVDVGHDEYWSAGQRATIESHVRRGGNLASLSGNTCFWQVRIEDGETLDASAGASGDRRGDVMVCHKYTAHDTDPVVAAGEPERMTGMWADPVVGLPEWSLLGAGSRWGLYSRFGQATPRGSGAFTVYRHEHWLFDGTDLRYGDLLGAANGVVGYETVGRPIDFDQYQLPIARPIDGAQGSTEIVAFTPASNIGVGEYPASISALSDQGDIEFIASRMFGEVTDDTLARCRYGNSVMMVNTPYPDGGGEVVVVGTTDWVFGLATDTAVAKVTANILDRYVAR